MAPLDAADCILGAVDRTFRCSKQHLRCSRWPFQVQQMGLLVAEDGTFNCNRLALLAATDGTFRCSKWELWVQQMALWVQQMALLGAANGTLGAADGNFWCSRWLFRCSRWDLQVQQMTIFRRSRQHFEVQKLALESSIHNQY